MEAFFSKLTQSFIKILAIIYRGTGLLPGGQTHIPIKPPDPVIQPIWKDLCIVRPYETHGFKIQ